MSTIHSDFFAEYASRSGLLAWLLEALARSGWATLPDNAEWNRSIERTH